MSKYHISHIFKDNMGIPLHQYILKKRLHASKNAILSDHPISHVYLQYGFKDYTSFSGHSKRSTVSPPRSTGSSTACLNSRITPYRGFN